MPITFSVLIKATDGKWFVASDNNGRDLVGLDASAADRWLAALRKQGFAARCEIETPNAD